jgi:hypothetical protein
MKEEYPTLGTFSVLSLHAERFDDPILLLVNRVCKLCFKVTPTAIAPNYSVGLCGPTLY